MKTARLSALHYGSFHESDSSRGPILGAARLIRCVDVKVTQTTFERLILPKPLLELVISREKSDSGHSSFKSIYLRPPKKV